MKMCWVSWIKQLTCWSVIEGHTFGVTDIGRRTKDLQMFSCSTHHVKTATPKKQDAASLSSVATSVLSYPMAIFLWTCQSKLRTAYQPTSNFLTFWIKICTYVPWFDGDCLWFRSVTSELLNSVNHWQILALMYGCSVCQKLPFPTRNMTRRWSRMCSFCCCMEMQKPNIAMPYPPWYLKIIL